MSEALPYAEVIGDPIDHSLSPIIHNFWLEKLGIRAAYRRRQITRARLTDYLAERRSDPGWRGCNVTMPLKLDALSLADEADDRALGAAAANTLVVRDGRLVAGNTDVGGMVTLFERIRASGAAMGTVTVLGNGGGARAALLALHLVGVKAVRVQSRDLAAALKLAVEFHLDAGPRLLAEPVVSDGLVNATPLGMTGMPPMAIDVSAMPDNGWVFDLVTAPAETALVRAARERGMTAATGLEMLVEQADASFTTFFGAKAPRAADAELMKALAR